jgi:hypothetical protein
MFTNAYKLACATGFKGTEQDFIAALRHAPKKESNMDYGQTKLSSDSPRCDCSGCKPANHSTAMLPPVSISKEEHPMQNISPDNFMALVNSLLSGGQLPRSSVTPSLSEARQNMSGDMGMHYAPNQQFAGEPKNYEIPEKIIASGQHSTIHNFVTLKMIPAFLQKLADAINAYSGFDLIREQRKIIARLSKLMSYQARPMSIIPTAIHDEFEMSIYKHYIAQQICSTNLSVEEGTKRVIAAQDALDARREACRINEEKQAEAKREKEVRTAAQDELADVLKDMGKLSATELSLRLRGIAEQVNPTPVVVQDSSNQTVAAPAVTAKDAYKEVLDSVDPKHSDIKISLNPGNSRSLDEIIPPHMRLFGAQTPPLTAEQISSFLSGGTFTHDGRRGTIGLHDLHPMDGPMGQGMMSHHFANQD